MSKLQTSILLTQEEMDILDKLCQTLKMSKSALIGQAIVLYKTNRRLNEEKEETHVNNYEQQSQNQQTQVYGSEL